ncbi:MAG: hypothetical protein QOH35_5830 [Acidobacteriaceae bacterium]|jgi:hypothetical protein|nr:hypothetical protein [Acidobacteriaceae bacterium]
MFSSATSAANILFLLKPSASLNRVWVLVVVDAGRTSPLVKVQSLFSFVPLVQCPLSNARGQALIPVFNLCPASKRRLIMLEKSRLFGAQHLH